MGSFFDWVIGNSVAKYQGRIVGGKRMLQGLEIATVAEATTTLFTAEMVLGGMINYDPAGGASTATLPTAALLVAALGDAAVIGTSFRLTFIHGGSTSEVVTLAAGDGNTLAPTTQAFDGAEALNVLVRIDNITSGSEAVTYYSTGLDLLST